MNKIDDILERLQKLPQPTVDHPDELTDSIMSALPDVEPVETKPLHRSRLYVITALSIAAGVALLLVLRFGNATEEPKQAYEGQQTAIHTAHSAERPASSQVSLSVSKADTSPREKEKAVNSHPSESLKAASLAKAEAATLPDASLAEARTAPRPHSVLDGSPAKAPARPADSTAILTARIEAEMQQISDDCYMEHLSRTINNDPQLKRLVDDFINEAAEDARTTVYVKNL